MHFDPTITFGNVFSALAVICAVAAATWKISLQLKKMQWKMNLIWAWYSKEHGIEDGGDDI